MLSLVEHEKSFITSGLISVHIACNIGYKSISALEQADIICHEWQEKR